MQQFAKYNDDDLLSNYYATKDNKWLGLLLQQYTTLLLGVGLKYFKNKELAADAVQQVFLKVLTTLPDTKVENFKGWLYILMRNHCLQELRKRKHVLGDELLQEQPAPSALDEEKMWLLEENIDRMEEAIAALDDGQQTCIKMFYLQKKTYQQIMEEKGYSFMQVKSYIQNGKRRLKTIMTVKEQGK